MASKRAEKQAEELLARLDVRSIPIDVEAVAGQLGATVKEEPFKKRDGLSGLLYRDGDVTIIGVNSMESLQRRRFTVAHEIGHLVLHEGDMVHVDAFHTFQINFRGTDFSPSTDRREIEANAFAASLLMPEEQIRRDFESKAKHGIDIDDRWIEDLAKNYGVSIQALTIRLSRLGLLNQLHF